MGRSTERTYQCDTPGCVATLSYYIDPARGEKEHEVRLFDEKWVKVEGRFGFLYYCSTHAAKMSASVKE